MTQKRKRFMEELIVNGGNATEAAAKVYDCCSRKSAQALGGKLSKVILKDEIEKRQAEVHEKLQERTIVTREWVIKGLVENLERAMTAKPVLDSKGIETGEYRYRGDVANRALELMGKDIGMFVERTASLDVTNLTAEEQVAKLAELRAKDANCG